MGHLQNCFSLLLFVMLVSFVFILSFDWEIDSVWFVGWLGTKQNACKNVLNPWALLWKLTKIIHEQVVHYTSIWKQYNICNAMVLHNKHERDANDFTKENMIRHRNVKIVCVNVCVVAVVVFFSFLFWFNLLKLKHGTVKIQFIYSLEFNDLVNLGSVFVIFFEKNQFSIFEWFEITELIANLYYSEQIVE